MPHYFIFNFVYVCGYVRVSAGAQGAQQCGVPLELLLQVVVSCLVWVLITKLGFSGQTESVLHC